MHKCVPFFTPGSGLAFGYKESQKNPHGKGTTFAWLAYLKDLGSVAVRSWPLAALGISRLVAIKGLGYQEHISEYGLHWNFFATIFCVRLVVVALKPLHSPRLKLMLALSVLCIYQWMLLGDLSTFIISAPRDTLFSMNREGICGIVGFVAIYVVADVFGRQINTHLRANAQEVRYSGG